MQVIASTHSNPTLATTDVEPVRWIGRRFPEANLREVALVRAPELDGRARAATSPRVWLALESLQTTGSFKVRGALVALDRIRERVGAGGRVVAASAGNHGAGVAYAARVLGLSATVVVPSGVPKTKRSRIEAYGASIVLAKTDSYDDAESRAKELASETGAMFVSPYDDADVVAGNGGSLGFEIVRAMGKVPDVVLAPLGGGGLATGLAHAFAHVGKLHPPSPPSHARRGGDAREMRGPPRLRGGAGGSSCVWGVQSEASPAMALSLQRGAAVERLPPAGATLAEGLEGGISKRAFERAREAIAGVIVVGEDEIARAMRYAFDEMGLVIEGSAAVALAPVLGGLELHPLGPPPRKQGGGTVSGDQDIVVVLTGRNVDRERLRAVLGSP